jgi:hypothetical protein
VAAVFFLVNPTYIGLIRELIEQTAADKAPLRVRRTMRIRSIITLLDFGAAALVALIYPLVGLAMCSGGLIVYLRPHPGGARN